MEDYRRCAMVDDEGRRKRLRGPGGDHLRWEHRAKKSMREMLPSSALDLRIRCSLHPYFFDEFIETIGMMSLLGNLVSGLLMMCDAGSQQLPFLALGAAQVCASCLQCDDRCVAARFSDLDIVQVQTG